MKTKANELRIVEKIKLLEDHEKFALSERKLAEKYKISKSQVHRILANKENLKKLEKVNKKRRRLNRM